MEPVSLESADRWMDWLGLGMEPVFLESSADQKGTADSLEAVIGYVEDGCLV